MNQKKSQAFLVGEEIARNERNYEIMVYNFEMLRARKFKIS